MAIRFRSLYTVEVRHAFFGGACDALQFVVPRATQSRLAGLHALARERDGSLHLLIETDDSLQPLTPPAGQRLLFGLRPRVASFATVTTPLPLQRGEVALWVNEVSPDALDAPRGVTLAGPRLHIAPRNATRPLALRLLDAAGVQRAATVLAAGDEAWSLPGSWPDGGWLVEEEAGGVTLAWRLQVDAELAAAGLCGLLAITVHEDHVAAGHDFAIEFGARDDTLRYYVVASRFGAADFEQLQVADAGFAGEGRPQILFNRLLPAAFGPTHLQPALLDPAGSARVALFETQTTVTRRQRGPSGITLSRNGDVLIGHLPQPGADRTDAQFIVHLSQP